MRRSWWLFILVLIPALLLISGCDDDDDEGTEARGVTFPAEPSKEKAFDLTQTQCPEIPEARKKVEERYQQNIMAAERIRMKSLQYWEKEYQHCLKNNQKRSEESPEDLGNCDEAWNRLQNSYAESVADVSNEGAYQAYQKTKDEWDTCLKELEKARIDAGLKPEDCFTNYFKAREAVENDHVRAMTRLKKEREDQLAFLKELEKKCAAGELHLTAQNKVKAIQYQSKFLPVDQLKTFIGPECDQEEHWHAKNSASAKATDSSVVPDPGGCGYGKTKAVPVVDAPM